MSSTQHRPRSLVFPWLILTFGTSGNAYLAFGGGRPGVSGALVILGLSALIHMGSQR